ncbi:ABC transporter permease [Actinomadura algeriensis]|uniref:Transport permease protein n=1 Tax=Actinomadura algeriensis TaxID=1679523 RepID=A0ABR9K4K0_9ACTN|nr:ABC transporter permease [Actinomadura algeriensis]MBE1537496.1 ABC-2 type transport system permease protein [Actinomadura algeriensis]
MYTKIITTEFRLRLREGHTLVFAFGLPLGLLAGFAVIPGSGDPADDLGGQTLAEYIASIGIGIAFAILGLMMMPAILAEYRERGVLRRMRATPARPSALLVAQLLFNAVTAAVSTLVLIGFGAAVFGVAAPRSPGWFAVSAAACMLALLALGSVVTAVAPTARAGNAIGMLLFFPSLFLAGVYIPYDQMPAALQRVCDFTPLGAGLEAVRSAWAGDAPEMSALAIMIGYGAVATAAAAKLFRWE